jgi:hypothetical protein
VLASTDPDLWVAVLPGESLSEMRARRDAAADILDSMLTEITAGSAAWEVAA